MVSNVNVKLVILGFLGFFNWLVLHPPGQLYTAARTEWNSHDAKQRVWFVVASCRWHLDLWLNSMGCSTLWLLLAAP